MATTKSSPYNLRFIWMICLVAAMGGLLFGYDWVVIGGAKPFYEPHFGISGEPLLPRPGHEQRSVRLPVWSGSCRHAERSFRA